MVSSTSPQGAHILPWVAEGVARVLASQRGHALLLHGPEGIGQFEFAMSLAKSWLCQTPQQQRSAGLACDHCASCHLVDLRTHPDLRLIVPETLRAQAGLSDEDASAAGEDGKKRKPSREIKVDQVRTALGFSELTASRGSLKVLVVHPAEAVNAIGANTLLKTLEEPSGAMRFVLSASAPHLLLPTIRSRCQSVQLDVPATQTSLDWLATQGLHRDEAETLLQVAGGQPLLAREQAQAGRTAQIWRDFPRLVMRQDAVALATWPLPVLVDGLQRLCHDLNCAAVDAPGRYFVSWKPPKLPLASVTSWAKDLRDLARHAEHPWSLALSAESVLQRAASVLNGASRSS